MKNKAETLPFSGCIFVDTPAACSWMRNGVCVALDTVPPQLISCALNHRHLIIREDAKPILRESWEAVISSGRYKKVQGQEGREDGFKYRDMLASGGAQIDG
jgi:hypothetical protein